MTTLTFPVSLPWTYPATRTQIWKSSNQEAVSGKETLLSLWSYPRWQWQLPFECLRTIAGTPDFYTLASFYGACYGASSPFLFTDPNDNQVTGQGIGVGDGATTAFQLVRALGGVGGFVEPIYAPNQVTAIYLNGTAVPSFTVTPYGQVGAGQVVLPSAPAAGTTISADFSFYFPCRFTDDQVDFDMTYADIYAAKKLSFQSLK